MQIIPPLSSVSVRAIRESPLQKGEPFVPRQSYGGKRPKARSAPEGSLAFPFGEGGPQRDGKAHVCLIGPLS